MNTDDDSIAARLYPSYSIGDRGDIAAKEYDIAAKATSDDARIYTNTSAAIALLAPLFISLTFGNFDGQFGYTEKPQVAALIIATIFFGSYFLFAHLSNLRRNYVYAVRKLIVLRRMLGQSYGASHLVLPNWRLEGADVPYAVHMFPGWRVRHLYPFYAITLLSASIASFALLNIAEATSLKYYVHGLSVSHFSWKYAFVAAVFLAWISLSLIAIRRLLFDDHENFRLLLAIGVAKLLRVKLTYKFEYILYRARLARAETYRLNVDLTNLKQIAVFREDKRFFSHGGFSIRSIGRAVVNRIISDERSGASTITQQLARTLFIHRPKPNIRRKLVEIILATWLTGKIEKEELLEIYLASVRYERGVDGVLAAMKFFFGQTIEKPSKAESFVLIERLANIRSLFRSRAIESSLRSAVDEKTMSLKDASEALSIYEKMIVRGRVHSSGSETPASVMQRLGL